MKGLLAMIRRLFQSDRDLKDAVAKLKAADERRKPVVAPIRKKIEERHRESGLVGNGAGNGH